MAKYKVLIVDDSAFMRKYISNILSSDNDLEVIATARNGEEAVRLAKELNPHVVTMDVEMPIMDGLTALEVIMKQHPTPVVMLSSLTTDGAEATLKALEIGAVDFVGKPSGTISLDLNKVKDELIQKVKVAAQARISRRVGGPIRTLPKLKQPLTSNAHKQLYKLVAIGTSTGGPKALQEVIPLIPRSIPAGILVVQHMPKGFTKSLADRLNSLSQIEVREAVDGDVIQPGLALIAPGDYHMLLQKSGSNYVIRLNQEPPVSGHRPSVDAMMHSVAKSDLELVGVIMTGMGGDGSDGMVEIKAKGGKTIAQDQDTCVVFGMPKVAIEKQCIDKIVPIQHIALEIMKML